MFKIFMECDASGSPFGQIAINLMDIVIIEEVDENISEVFFYERCSLDSKFLGIKINELVDIYNKEIWGCKS